MNSLFSKTLPQRSPCIKSCNIHGNGGKVYFLSSFFLGGAWLYASILCLRIVFVFLCWTVFVVVVAWYTSNYLSLTIYVFSENGATSMISAYWFILLIFFPCKLLGCLDIFPFKLYETLSLKWCHNSFIMYYICNQNHLKACYDDNEIFNKHLYILYESYY